MKTAYFLSNPATGSWALRYLGQWTKARRDDPVVAPMRRAQA
jgi:hypothetical protein